MRFYSFCCFLFLFTLLFSIDIYSQSRPNFGLTRQQPVTSLPKTAVPFDAPVRKSKIKIDAVATKVANNHYLLNNGWEMADAITALSGGYSVFNENYLTDNWYNATVPGTVLTTLVDQGVYPDPYIGLNNMAIPDTLCRQDWWYRLKFITPEQNGNVSCKLRFDGINYKAVYWLNGKLLGETEGAFKRAEFDVTHLLKKNDKNILVVHILPPPNPGIPHEQSAVSGMGPNGGQLAMDGPTFISSEGWDWVPGIRDRNIGIWQNVNLIYTGSVELVDPQIITDLPLPDTSSANITIIAGLRNTSATAQTVFLKGSFEQTTFSVPVLLQPGEYKRITVSPATHPALLMKNPKLWWPNGYGNQFLYTLKLNVEQNGEVSDYRNIRFGVREYSYELMADEKPNQPRRILYSPTDVKEKKAMFDHVNRRDFGNRIFIPSLRTGVHEYEVLPDTTNPFLVIKINGQKIFCKGGNWGMDDGMKRVTRERLEPSFRLHKEANYNMIRNWTGESTEEVFYELADEYGMLIWNDFWLSTEGYNLNPLNQSLWLSNSLDVIRRFRNHPSIAVWCPRNEGYAPAGIEEELYEQVMQEDGTRHYIGNSRELNLRQSGDWHYVENPALYFTKYAEGFSTEIGTFSVPAATTIRKFIKPADQWPINDAWHYHDLHTNNQNLQGYLRAVDSLYGAANGLDDFNRKIQLINYESHRAMFEAWNSKLWKNASGVLLWMTHPAWPSMIWQTYSWDYETHAAYFATKKACEPLHVQMNLHDKKILLVNTSLKSYSSLEAFYSIYDLNGKRLFFQKQKTESIYNSIEELFVAAPTEIRLPAVYLVRLQVKNKNGELLSENSYWKTNQTNKDFKDFNQLSQSAFQISRVQKKGEQILFQIENKSSVTAVGIKLNLCNENNEILLPAIFSDGYFTLLAGEKKIMTVSFSGKEQQLLIRTEAYNSKEVYHSILK